MTIFYLEGIWRLKRELMFHLFFKMLANLGIISQTAATAFVWENVAPLQKHRLHPCIWVTGLQAFQVRGQTTYIYTTPVRCKFNKIQCIIRYSIQNPIGNSTYPEELSRRKNNLEEKQRPGH